MGKKRSFSSDPVTETHQHLLNEIESAERLVPKLQEPSIPNTSQISDLSEDQLMDLQSTMSSLRTQSVSALESWESYQQHLKQCVDAASLLMSLKSEPESKKRRRTTSTMFSGGAGGSDTTVGIVVGAQVAFRLPSLQEEWIVCEVLGSSDGIYELRDPELDEDGNPGRTYTGKAKDIIPIPSPDSSFSTYAQGTQVLAQYPETTAFYRAEVVSQKNNKVRLIFEGEEEDNKLTEVERYLVLPIS